MNLLDISALLTTPPLVEAVATSAGWRITEKTHFVKRDNL